ncbi:MAG: hypothetical protein HN929_04015 [Chloroflexi bacterium]|jgi:hypothetical protein|nr:hypothetical protein [Chloroflexota bacterium]MBT7080621.1 hypothetical protein [Chloroflexota bacterium]MBT7289990.1 hypothetical protein [Chloroflexota bacterium]
MINTIIPAITSIISLIFAIIVLDQYLVNKKAYQLVWFFGLLLYFISTGCAFLIELNGLTEVKYLLWYICGATLVAAYLGMGTIYLLIQKRIANIIMIALVVASITAIILISIADVDIKLLPASGPILSGDALPKSVRWLTPTFNTFGTIALVGGAGYSAYHYWSHRLLRHRVTSNILIAAGALLAAAGGLVARWGYESFLYWSELLGIILIFIGFLRSSEKFGFDRIPLIHRFLRKSTD